MSRFGSHILIPVNLNIFYVLLYKEYYLLGTIFKLLARREFEILDRSALVSKFQTFEFKAVTAQKEQKVRSFFNLIKKMLVKKTYPSSSTITTYQGHRTSTLYGLHCLEDYLQWAEPKDKSIVKVSINLVSKF